VDHLAQILGTMNGDSRRKLLVIPHDDVHLLLALVHDVGFSDGMSESQAKTIEEWLRQIAAERRIRLIQPRLNGRYVEFEQAVVERRADDGGGVSHRVVEVKKFGLAVDNVIIRPAEVVVAI
ncbi:hypothetical protein JZU57_00995, partial [bacterium]|nr:hypothetical protein [bacterium]